MSARPFAPLDFAQLLLVALMWAINNICAKVAVDAFPAMLTVALRFVMVLAIAAFWIKAAPRGKWAPFLVMLICLGPIHYGAQYVGLKLSDNIAPLVVALQLWAPLSVVFAAVLLKESASPLRWTGVAIAFLGAASMNFDPAVFADGTSLLLMVVASAAYALGTVLVRRIGGVDTWSMQGWIALMTVPTMGGGSLAIEDHQLEAIQSAGWLPWACIAYGAFISSIVAGILLFRLVQRYEVSRTTPYLLLTPVISIGLANLLLGNVVTPQVLIGAAVTMAGVVLVAVAERRFKAVT